MLIKIYTDAVEESVYFLAIVTYILIVIAVLIKVRNFKNRY